VELQRAAGSQGGLMGENAGGGGFPEFLYASSAGLALILEQWQCSSVCLFSTKARNSNVKALMAYPDVKIVASLVYRC
jgi:hypothetical protein